MTRVLVHIALEGPTTFREVFQAARAKLTGEYEAEATLTEAQALQFGSGAKVNAPLSTDTAVADWRDECLLTPGAEAGVAFHARGEINGVHGLWLCGWVEDAAKEEKA